MNPREQGPEGTGTAAEAQASKGPVPEGFFFAQQTHLGRQRKIPTAQAVATPEGAAPGTTRAGAGPAGDLAKKIEQSQRSLLCELVIDGCGREGWHG